MSAVTIAIRTLGVAGVLAGTLSCTAVGTPQPGRSSMRAVGDQYQTQVLDTPQVNDLLTACDVMARDLVFSGIVQRADHPLVIEIKPFQNNTGTPIDLLIIPQTIRAKILESGSGKLAFRDGSARVDIIEERVNQTDQPRTFEQNTSIRRPAGSAGQPLTDSSTANAEVKGSGTVSGQLATADYFLFGKIYAQDEKPGQGYTRGMRYFQFHAWLTDTRTGLIVWEKTYRVKREGVISGR